MSDFVDREGDPAFLLPSDLRNWIPEDDSAPFVIAAVAGRFMQVLLLAKALKLVKVAVVSMDGSMFDASASKYRSVTHERAVALPQAFPNPTARSQRPLPHNKPTNSGAKPRRASGPTDC